MTPVKISVIFFIKINYSLNKLKVQLNVNDIRLYWMELILNMKWYFKMNWCIINYQVVVVGLTSMFYCGAQLRKSPVADDYTVSLSQGCKKSRKLQDPRLKIRNLN